MKKSIVLLLIALALVALIVAASVLYSNLKDSVKTSSLTVSATKPSTDSQEEAPQNPAPNFKVYDKEGNHIRLSYYEGKPVVLNFWASWCGPCQSEMPAFQEKYEQYGQDIQFLMVNMTTGRETKESALDFLAGTDYTFPVYFDTDMDAAMAYSVYSLPTTYFIDKEGNIIAYAAGALDAETLQQGIDMILP